MLATSQVPQESSGQVTAVCHSGQRPLGTRLSPDLTLGITQPPLGDPSSWLLARLSVFGRERRLRAWRRGAGVESEASLGPHLPDPLLSTMTVPTLGPSHPSGRSGTTWGLIRAGPRPLNVTLNIIITWGTKRTGSWWKPQGTNSNTTPG